jgi:hypothetical protein
MSHTSPLLRAWKSLGNRLHRARGRPPGPLATLRGMTKDAPFEAAR